jgi:hypothetical protein
LERAELSLGLFIGPENGGDIFLRNILQWRNYTQLQPVRSCSWGARALEPEIRHIVLLLHPCKSGLSSRIARVSRISESGHWRNCTEWR